MSNKFLYSLIILAIFLFSPLITLAQSAHQDSVRQARQHITDSIQAARKHYTDSLRAARQRTIDSVKAARQASLDSMRAVQQRRTDSLRAIQAYRKSDRYADSVAALRQHRRDSAMAVRQHIIDSTRTARQHYTDSLRTARQHTIDSMKVARQHYNDSIRAHFDSVRVARAKELEKVKAERARVSDSLAVIRAYRKSDRYKDSLAAIRQHRRDSIVAVRKHYTDSVRSVQKAKTDSMIAARKAYNDSLRASLDSIRLVRQHTIDSLKTVRQARADSLAKVREVREAEREKKKEEREKEKSLALEIKIKKKQDNYSNKKMLKKKWSLPRRVVQNTFTRYNYYYNADLKMEEAKANMLRSRQDDYDSLLSLFPFDPNVDSAKLASDMDTIIKKASVGIQIHDPRAKWQDDLYLLVGQAYYYKADYQNAGAAFKQIIVTDEKIKKRRGKKKRKSARDDNKQQTFSVPQKSGIAGLLQHMPAKNKAMLWLARTFVQSGEEGQAQTLLDMLRNDANFPSSMQGRLALEQAFIELNNHNDKNSLRSLALVVADENIPKWQRQRAGFIAGQLFEKTGKLDSANHYFKEVVTLHPPIQMDFYARKNIAFNEMKGDGNSGQSVALLENLAKDGKYQPFYDQIYYGIALAEMQSGDDIKAKQSLRKSIEFGENNPKQMGLSYTELGDLYYRKQAYLPAKGAYDSAAALLTSFPNMEAYQRASLRGSALAQIVYPADQVSRADSLLHLATLSEKEQRSIIRKYIRQMERAKQDSLFLASNASGNPAGGNLFTQPNVAAQNWYFSNPSRVSSGINAFKQKWGNRKLADNWRLSNNNMGGNNNAGEESSEATENIYSGIPDEETLYDAIPHTPEALAAVKDTLRESLFHLGKGYYTYLEDFPNAIHTFDTLGQRFPAHEHRDEVLYLRYLIAMRMNETTNANNYQQQLIEGFPDSRWTALLKEATHQDNNETVANTVQDSGNVNLDAYYNETYNMLMKKQYALVLERARTYSTKYPVPGSYAHKFKLLEAVAYAGSGNYQQADSILNSFIKQNPDDELTNWAKDVLKYINRVEHPEVVTGVRDSVKDTKAPKASYTFDSEAPYYIIIVAPADMRIFALKSGLRDFNLMRESGEHVSISMTTLTPENNLIIFRTFQNLAEAKSYFKEVQKNSKLFREYPNREYHLLLISEHNYDQMMNSRNLQPYLEFYKKHYK